MTNTDDRPTETFLRERFARDADSAVVPSDLHGLAEAAAARGRAQRRRTAAVGVAVVAAVAVGGVVAVDALNPGAGSAVPGSSAPVASADASPTVPEVDRTSAALMFRGVEVAVPASWLEPEAVRCGTPVRDAAYVVDVSVPFDLCDMNPPQQRLTTVVMQPLEDLPTQSRDAGSRWLPDGRWEVTSAIPDRDVWLTVTSPSQARAEALFDSAVIVGQPKGCAIHPGPVPDPSEAGLPDRSDLPAGTTGRVCGYRAGWVTGAVLLDADQTQSLGSVIGQLPVWNPVDCAVGKERGVSGYWITLDQQRFWLDAGGCAYLVNADGHVAAVTGELVSRLWGLASGPASFMGVVG